jgi:hypothetical protein
MGKDVPRGKDNRRLDQGQHRLWRRPPPQQKEIRSPQLESWTTLRGEWIPFGGSSMNCPQLIIDGWHTPCCTSAGMSSGMG